MQQFQVPQFIDVEDKLFWSLTFKQFMYLAGGAGLCFILYVYIPFLVLSIIPIAAVAGISISLAFVKVNGRPFSSTLEAFIKYLMTKKLYVWKKEEKKRSANMGQNEIQTATTSGVRVPKLSEGKLRELSWSLDVKPGNEEE
jgi:hypothetical protein